MSLATALGEKSRLRALLDHLSVIEDPREAWRVAHPLPEVLLLVVCGTIADCDDYETIAAWGKQRLEFLRRFLPYHHGVPGARWLTLLMNRIDPGLFSACFSAWVREVWPDRPELIAIDGKTARRSHNRSIGQGPLHLVSAFATSARLVLGQEAVDEKSTETSAIPLLLERLAAGGALKGAIVTIDAIACNADIAAAVTAAGADYLLAVKANQPTLQTEIETFFQDAPSAELDTFTDLDKGHGRIEERTVTVAREVEWLSGDRRFPGELRLPDVAAIIKVATAPSSRTAAASTPDTTSPLPTSPPRPPPMPCAAIGASKTASTGSSMSSSTRISRVCEPAMAPGTWPSSGTSPSISCAKPKTTRASGSAENSPDGTRTTSPQSSTQSPVNPDSLPCSAAASQIEDEGRCGPTRALSGGT